MGAGIRPTTVDFRTAPLAEFQGLDETSRHPTARVEVGPSRCVNSRPTRRVNRVRHAPHVERKTGEAFRLLRGIAQSFVEPVKSLEPRDDAHLDQRDALPLKPRLGVAHQSRAVRTPSPLGKHRQSLDAALCFLLGISTEADRADRYAPEGCQDDRAPALHPALDTFRRLEGHVPRVVFQPESQDFSLALERPTHYLGYQLGIRGPGVLIPQRGGHAAVLEAGDLVDDALDARHDTMCSRAMRRHRPRWPRREPHDVDRERLAAQAFGAYPNSDTWTGAMRSALCRAASMTAIECRTDRPLASGVAPVRQHSANSRI